MGRISGQKCADHAPVLWVLIETLQNVKLDRTNVHIKARNVYFGHTPQRSRLLAGVGDAAVHRAEGHAPAKQVSITHV